MICKLGYEFPNTGSCKGDSGGPIVYFYPGNRAGEDKYIQIGIVQGGIGLCGYPQYPAIYVRLEDKEVLDFVNDGVKALEYDFKIAKPNGKLFYNMNITHFKSHIL